MLSGIYVVTDSLLDPTRSHLDIAKAAIDGGACCIQLREKEASRGDLLLVAKSIGRLAKEAGIPFIVNDDVELARLCGADGAHVGQSDMAMAVARGVLGPEAIIGVSVATVSEAIRAAKDGADYLGVGPVFATATKADAGNATGLDVIREIKHSVDLPIVAIGGISLANIASVANAGADSAAVISAVVCTEDMSEAVRTLRFEWENAGGCSIDSI